VNVSARWCHAKHGGVPAPARLALLGLAWIVPWAVPASAATPCDVHYPSDAGIEWRCVRVARGKTLEALFGAGWVDVVRFNRIDRRHVWPGARIRVPLRLEDIECFTPMPEREARGDTIEKLVVVNLDEQFLAVYIYGQMQFSAPVATGGAMHPTPSGWFRIDAWDRDHVSSLYDIEGMGRPYPMRFGLRFHVDREGRSYWIHGRDLPGNPGSHGCIGLYDEAMQLDCYGEPRDPVLADAERLYLWVVGEDAATAGRLEPGIPLWVVGKAPVPGR
jgi:hypothetical protein